MNKLKTKPKEPESISKSLFLIIADLRLKEQNEDRLQELNDLIKWLKPKVV